MTKREFIRKVAENSGWSIAKTDEIVGVVFDTITNELAAGECIKIPGFGIFDTIERHSRKGRNPHTGEEMIVPAVKSPKFKPGRALKRSVADGHGDQEQATGVF